MMTKDNNTRHQLYRHFDCEGNLLYVGISINAIARFGEHNTNSEWISDVARMEIEKFPDKASVLEAERKAIQEEKPWYNIKHNDLGSLRNEKKRKKRKKPDKSQDYNWPDVPDEHAISLSRDGVEFMRFDDRIVSFDDVKRAANEEADSLKNGKKTGRFKGFNRLTRIAVKKMESMSDEILDDIFEKKT